MKSYLSYFKLRLLTNFQYRAAALAGLSTQVFFGFVYVFVYIALYQSNIGVNAPMDLSHLVSYAWLGQAFLYLTYPYIADTELIEMIRDGNIAYELIRPQSFYLKFYIKIYTSRVAGVLLRFSPIIIMSLLLPKPYNLIFPSSIGSLIVFILALLLASLLITSLTLIIHILIMFLYDSRGIFTFYSVLAELFMGALIPLPFLPSFLRKISYVLPFRFISDFPYRVYTGDIPLKTGIYSLGLSLIWIIIIVYIGFLIARKALKKAVIQGG